MKVDFFIVGGGLAGSILAWTLHQQGQKVLVFDSEPDVSCSKLAAGIINPVTGKRLVKSWQFEKLYAFAKRVYLQMEAEWKVKLLYEQRIFRAFRQMQLQNQWALRLGDPAYSSLLALPQKQPPEPGLFRQASAYGCICTAARLDIPLLLTSIRKAFAERQTASGSAFIREHFNYGQMHIGDKYLTYGPHQASAVVFCEGYQLKNNPWFAHLPLNPAKGHLLHLTFDNELYRQSYMYKDDLYFVALNANTIWCGADYVWDFEDDRPEPKRIEELEMRLKRVLQKPYQIKDAFAAIRPTVKDRRPLLGQHPQYPQLYVFNGLGTKGSSLAPYFAAQMAAFLLDGTSPDAEVLADRHASY